MAERGDYELRKEILNAYDNWHETPREIATRVWKGHNKDRDKSDNGSPRFHSREGAEEREDYVEETLRQHRQNW